MTAADIQRIKDLLPTSLGSDELRSSIASDILRRSVLSAHTATTGHHTSTLQDGVQIFKG